MPSNCVAYGCFNKGKIDGITYHRFPKDPEIRQQWTNAVKRKDWEPKERSLLCSSHFREVDIDRTSLSCVRIREGAVPCIFPAFSKVRDRRILKRHASEDKAEECTPQVNVETPTKKIKLQLHKVEGGLSKCKRKIKVLQQSKRRLKKRVVRLEDIVKTLKEKLNFQDEQCSFLTSISKNSECLIKRAKEKTLNPGLKQVYDDRLKAFSITLHFLSPKAYSYIRKTFNSALPHPRTLRRWYSSINVEPGFSTEVFRALKEHSANIVHKPICCLMLDCMAIRKRLEWDGKRFHGTVNPGTTLIDDDSAPEATEALVFHLVAINGTWKVPVGHFFVDAVNGEQLSGLVKQCLSLLHDSNITVASLTCDGTACNVSMAEKLGCSIRCETLKPWFLHPDSGERVHFFMDPCHMLKLVRNTLGDYKKLRDAKHMPIEWRYIEQLHDLQKSEGLHLANKLTNSHVQFQKQIMKVKLAAQVLSSSVADSLDYLLKNKQDKFEDCSATIEFIRMFDMVFDILNSRSIFGKYGKQALCPLNFEHRKAFLLKAKDYISTLKDNTGQLIIKSRRKTGFLGFMACIESALAMYEQYVLKGPLKYIPLYKASQDHLERLFGYIRSRGGSNNNPTCRQFTASMKRILLHKELEESNTGNTLVLNRSLIFTINKKNKEADEINLSTPGFRALEDGDLTTSYGKDHLHDEESITRILGSTTEIGLDIVEYVAGYVARTLSSKIVCVSCCELLVCNISNVNSLIHCKNRGGLVQPSESVLKLCLVSESVFKNYVNTGKLLTTKNLIQVMTRDVMTLCIDTNLFSGNHNMDNEPEQNHIVLLMKALCNKYFTVRLHHHTKIVNDSLHKSKVRSHLTKVITFLGQ